MELAVEKDVSETKRRKDSPASHASSDSDVKVTTCNSYHTSCSLHCAPSIIGKKEAKSGTKRNQVKYLPYYHEEGALHVAVYRALYG